jgi:hypothetical protein
MVMFRVSGAAAEALAQYIAPHYSAQDLMTLPDHSAMARIKIDNVPSPVFVMQTRPAGAAAPDPAVGEQPESRPTVASPPAVAKEDEEARRDAFVARLQFDEDLLDASSCAALAAEGARGMSDLVALSPAAQDELIGKLKSIRDRALLRGLVRRVPRNPQICVSDASLQAPA